MFSRVSLKIQNLTIKTQKAVDSQPQDIHTCHILKASQSFNEILPQPLGGL